MLRVYVRRHGPRKVVKGGVITKEGLTPEGKKHAAQLGKKLAKRKQQLVVVSTFMDRSKQTAKLIAHHGKGKFLKKERNSFIHFVKDQSRIKELDPFFSQSAYKVISTWLEGKANYNILYTPHEMALEAVRAMRNAPRASERSKGKNTRIEAISHDITIVALFSELTGIKPKFSEKKPFADFLDALRFDFGNGRVNMHYHGKKYDVTSKFKLLAEEASQKRRKDLGLV